MARVRGARHVGGAGPVEVTAPAAGTPVAEVSPTGYRVEGRTLDDALYALHQPHHDRAIG